MDDSQLPGNGNHDTPPRNFPSRLRYFREQRLLSKTDLAEKAGLAYRTVHNLETVPGKNPQDKTLLLLAKALGLTIDELRGNGADDLAEAAGSSARQRRVLPFSLALVAVLMVSLLVSFSLSHAKWEITDTGLEARDGLAGITIWKYQSRAGIKLCQEAPWNPAVLLVGTWFNSPAGGSLLALDRRTGKQLWEVRPDVGQMREVFGSEMVDSAPFGVVRIGAWDSDGDGIPEAYVNFVHGKYFPSALCAVDAEGNEFGQYNLIGHVRQIVAWDLNADGRDELIVGSTNNAKAYQGGMVTVLNREHFRGASIDSLAAPQATMPDSALARVVFPAFPAPYMALMSVQRLAAEDIQVFENAQGETDLSIVICGGRDERVIVFMDSDLQPTGSDIEDVFRDALKSWPDSLTTGRGPADDQWRADWLSTHRHFTAGHWPPG